MWPWEHAAFAYVLYSLGMHARSRSPEGDPVIVLVFASVLPDLIDKPLAWTFGVFPQGYSIGHSIFVAPFLLGAVFALARRYRRTPLAVAFAVGHLSHLAGDVFYPVVEGEGFAFEALLWPVVKLPAYEVGRGSVGRVFYYLLRHAHRFTDPELGPLLVFELALFGSVVVLWLYDGAPVLREALRAVADRV